MAKVDILIKTDGTEAQSQELGQSESSISQSSTQAIKPSGTGGARHLVTRSVYANQLAQAGLNTIKQGFEFAKSNYGNFTGDYIQQQKIDNAFSKVSALASVGGSIAAGAAVGGVPGAVVGAIVSGVSLVSNFIQNEITYNLQLSKANRQANFNSQRIGAILTNGNR